MSDDPKYMADSRGRMVPVEIIEEIDIARDTLVNEIHRNALEVNQALGEFKSHTLGDIGAFCELSAEKFGIKRGGRKGNLSLVSFNGRIRIQVAISETITFDERLHAAKLLIDECLHEWTSDSRPEVQVIINDAFQVDKEGNISTTKVLGLRRLDIKDERWLKAMEAIGKSVQVMDTKSYIRIYERDNVDAPWRALSLDIASA